MRIRYIENKKFNQLFFWFRGFMKIKYNHKSINGSATNFEIEVASSILMFVLPILVDLLKLL